MGTNLRKILLVAVALGLGGCQSMVDFSDWAQGYDKAVEKARNQGILLNMVRAAYNDPLHFSTIAVVRGNGQISPTLSATVPFGASPLPTLRPTKSLTAGVSISEGFNFDMASLDNAEFMKGLLTPINPSTVNLYIKEGIPAELLFHLLINSITVSDGKQTVTYVNDPTRDDYAGFVAALGTMLKLGFTTEDVSSLVPFGPPLTTAEAKDTQRLATAAQAGLILQQIGTGPNATYQLVRPVSGARFCFMGAADMPPLPISALCQRAQKGGTAETARPPDTGLQSFSVGQGFAGFANSTLIVDARSTRDVFNYLGNVIYEEVNNPKSTPLVMQTGEAKAYNYLHKGEDLLVVKKNDSHSNDLISIDYLGDTYSIPYADQGNSALVVTLVTQILELSTSINLIPATSAVVISGSNGH